MRWTKHRTLPLADASRRSAADRPPASTTPRGRANRLDIVGAVTDWLGADDGHGAERFSRVAIYVMLVVAAFNVLFRLVAR